MCQILSTLFRSTRTQHTSAKGYLVRYDRHLLDAAHEACEIGG